MPGCSIGLDPQLHGPSVSAGTLYDKGWDLHQVAQLPGNAIHLTPLEHGSGAGKPC